MHARCKDDSLPLDGTRGDQDKPGANGRPRFWPLASAESGRRGNGMEIKVQISVSSEAGQPEVIQQVARLERGTLRSDTLGLSLAEARSILAELEQALVERQTIELIAQA